MMHKLQSKPQHDPVENTIRALKTLLQCLETKYSVVEEMNHLAGLLLEDAKILFREYWRGPRENKWDDYPAERMEVMRLIRHSQRTNLDGVAGEDLYSTMEEIICHAKHETWDKKLPLNEHIVRFLSQILEDLERFQGMRAKKQHIA